MKIPQTNNQALVLIRLIECQQWLATDREFVRAKNNASQIFDIGFELKQRPHKTSDLLL